MTQSTRRRYAQFCPLARALDVVGERWTLLLIRNLLVGPQRYSELLEGLPGITTNLLAKRLKEMKAQGLIEPRQSHGVTLYAVTDRGRALEEPLLALAHWGEKEPVPKEGHRNLRWAMLGMRRRYRGGVEALVRVVSENPAREFLLQFAEKLEFRESLPRSADLEIRGDEAQLFALIYRRRPARDLLRSGSITLRGDGKVLSKILTATQP